MAELLKLTGKDGERVEINPRHILYMKGLKAAGAEIVLADGKSVFVRQNLDWIFANNDIERPKQRLVAPTWSTAPHTFPAGEI